MKNTKKIIIGGIMTATLFGTAVFADATETKATKAKQYREWSNSGTIAKKKAQMETFKSKVTTTVTDIIDGIQITQTTSDSGALAKLNDMFVKSQKFKSKDAKAPIKMFTSQISNGIITTITSDNASMIKQIQSQKNMQSPGMTKDYQKGNGKIKKVTTQTKNDKVVKITKKDMKNSSKKTAE
ncbi:MAG: hypothetical protein PHS92_04860 [Candidatus Gracilibacteria bacterium]|nr:hypothetical protein [Candidatus Gracilibacteria bacterium]